MMTGPWVACARLVPHLAAPRTRLVLKLDVGAVKLLDEFCAEHHAEADEYEGLEAGWFGKGRGYVVRLAGVLSLLAWSETDGVVPPPPITAEVVGDAAGLWADYFWPVARTTFAGAGRTPADRQARRIIAWIRRTGASTICMEDVRVRALGRTVTPPRRPPLSTDSSKAASCARLPPPAKGGPGRPAIRWEVNPALHAQSRRVTMRKWLRDPVPEYRKYRKYRKSLHGRAPSGSTLRSHFRYLRYFRHRSWA